MTFFHYNNTIASVNSPFRIKDEITSDYWLKQSNNGTLFEIELSPHLINNKRSFWEQITFAPNFYNKYFNVYEISEDIFSSYDDETIIEQNSDSFTAEDIGFYTIVKMLTDFGGFYGSLMVVTGYLLKIIYKKLLLKRLHKISNEQNYNEELP